MQTISADWLDQRKQPFELALDAASAWQTWEILRWHQGLSVEKARRTVARIISAVLNSRDRR